MRKYDEIMEHLVVTEQMKQRILSKVNAASVKKKKDGNTIYLLSETARCRCLLCGSRSGSLSYQRKILEFSTE